MIVPTRTTVKDIETICKYLVTKPTGAKNAEAKAVISTSIWVSRKIDALKYFGLVEDEGDKTKITQRGRSFVAENFAFSSVVLLDVILDVQPYFAVIDKILRNNKYSLTATEIAAFWNDHYKNQTSGSESMLMEQVSCFFNIAEGADLGKKIVGRKGKMTRFEFDPDQIQGLVNHLGNTRSVVVSKSQTIESKDDSIQTDESARFNEQDRLARYQGASESETNKVFISHGTNKKILSQLKELLKYGKFEPVVAIENETTAIPVPTKVLDEMKKCKGAVIHVSTDSVVRDINDNELRQKNENVLIEIGAALALYGEKIILLVEDGVRLPSNLQGLYKCSYQGDELEMKAVMKLLKALSKF